MVRMVSMVLYGLIPLIIILSYLSGWWYTYPSEKYEFVSWDMIIPNIWKKHVPNHQPVMNQCGTPKLAKLTFD